MENGGSAKHRSVTVSMGIASTRADDAVTPELLIARADRALYRAKTLGKDRAETSEADQDLGQSAHAFPGTPLPCS
jgi:PleD family two-component response regulator